MDVFAVSLRSPAIKIERPESITAQGAFLWASGGIRTRKESTYIRQTPQAHNDQERLASRIISPVPKSEPHATTK